MSNRTCTYLTILLEIVRGNWIMKNVHESNRQSLSLLLPSSLCFTPPASPLCLRSDVWAHYMHKTEFIRQREMFKFAKWTMQEVHIPLRMVVWVCAASIRHQQSIVRSTCVGQKRLHSPYSIGDSNETHTYTYRTYGNCQAVRHWRTARRSRSNDGKIF